MGLSTTNQPFEGSPILGKPRCQLRCQHFQCYAHLWKNPCPCRTCSELPASVHICMLKCKRKKKAQWTTSVVQLETPLRYIIASMLQMPVWPLQDRSFRGMGCKQYSSSSAKSAATKRNYLGWLVGEVKHRRLFRLLLLLLPWLSLENAKPPSDTGALTRHTLPSLFLFLKTYLLTSHASHISRYYPMDSKSMKHSEINVTALRNRALSWVIEVPPNHPLKWEFPGTKPSN